MDVSEYDSQGSSSSPESESTYFTCKTWFEKFPFFLLCKRMTCHIILEQLQFVILMQAKNIWQFLKFLAIMWFMGVGNSSSE